MTLIEEIERLIKPPIETLDLTLYEVSLTYEQGVHYLRVLIERSNGEPIHLDDIVHVTESISPLLDQANLIQHTYTLDVASSGAEHEVEVTQLDRYVNRLLRFELTMPFEGNHVVQGRLIACEPQQLTLEYRVKTRLKRMMIDRNHIKKANLAVQ